MPLSSSASPVLHIQLFGRFLVNVDGQAVSDKGWVRRSAKTLVKLLALTPPHTLHREQVIELLWPELAPRTAANNLDKALHGARRALEPTLTKGAQSRFLLTPRNQIVLTSPGALRVDALDFEEAANQALRQRDAMAVRAALRLYGGALLVDDLYEEWSLARRESLRLLFRTASLSAAEGFVQDGHAAGGIELVRRLVHDDAADEAAHRLLMRLYAESGRQDQALMQFEQCRKLLRAAGLEPGPETLQLQRALRDSRVNPALAAGEAGATWVPQVLPLTFRSGIIRAVRSAPDGRSVVLRANWNPRNPGGAQSDFALYRLTPETGEVQPLPLGDVELFAVLPGDRLLVGLAPRTNGGFVTRSTLALQPAKGGPAVPLLEGVECADLRPGPDTRSVAALTGRLAIVRELGGRSRLEFPIGQVLFETGGWISHPRFSADGRRIAFIDHPIPMDDEGRVVVIDLGGAAEHEQGEQGEQVLTQDFLSIQGLAWLDDQLWFTALRKGTNRSLHCVGLDGTERAMFHGLGNLTLHDGVAPRRLLVAAERGSHATFARHADDPVERDITWHEWTTPRDVSADGRTLLVEEGGTGGRHDYVAYLRATDGSSTRLLGDGVPLVFSPDQRQVILRLPGPPSRLAVLDLASGSRTLLEADEAQPLTHTEYVSFLPDGGRIVFSATDPVRGPGIYTQDLAGGRPERFAPGEAGLKMHTNQAIAPDGQRLVLKNAQDRLCLYRLADGRGMPLEPLSADFNMLRWAEDGAHLFVRRWGEIPATVYRYALADGRLDEWLVLDPGQVGDALPITPVRLGPDGRSYAYGFKKVAFDLYSFNEV